MPKFTFQIVNYFCAFCSKAEVPTNKIVSGSRKKKSSPGGSATLPSFNQNYHDAKMVTVSVYSLHQISRSLLLSTHQNFTYISMFTSVCCSFLSWKKGTRGVGFVSVWVSLQLLQGASQTSPHDSLIITGPCRHSWHWWPCRPASWSRRAWGWWSCRVPSTCGPAGSRTWGCSGSQCRGRSSYCTPTGCAHAH